MVEDNFAKDRMMVRDWMKMGQMAATVALLAGTGIVQVPRVMAQAATEQGFDIPAGPLGAAVARLGQQAGIIITVDPDLIRGKQTSGLSGRFTTVAALERLLAGSGLRAQVGPGGTYSLAPLPAPLRAGAREQEAATDLAEIVVVGVLTDVAIDQREIEMRQASDLSDLFRQVPSVSVGGSVGIAQKIYVRGLEDSLLNVTVDGAPQHGTLFHHVGRVSIEPELLKSVEVQAGAGEATSGFGAIGGAIRFRTKDVDDLLAPDRNMGGIAKAGWFSNDGYKLSGTLYGRVAGDIGFVGSYVRVDRDDMKDGAGNRLRGTSAEQELGFVKLGGLVAEDHHLSVSFEQRDEKASFGQRPNWPVLEGARLFPAEGKRQTGVVNYQADLGLAELEATGYWTRSRFIQDRYDRWGLYGGSIRSRGADLRARVDLDAHDITVGGEYRDDQVVGEYQGDPAVWGKWAWSTVVGRFKEKGELLSFYVQDHWQVAEPLLLSLGARYDAYDLEQVTYANGTDSDGISLNAGLNYQITDAVSANIGYAQAFRGKEIGDAFTLEKRPGRISLSPTLKPEKVGNFETGLAYDQDGFRASVAYYNMRIKDVILDQIGNGAPPQDAVHYENVGRFRAKGVELRAGYSHGPFAIDAYYNHYRSRLNGDLIEGYEHIGLGNSVGDNWSVTAGYAPTQDLGFEVAVTRFDALNDIEVLQRGVAIGWIGETQYVSKPGYTVVDLFARWQPLDDDSLTVTAGVYNLFDKLYRAHASVADYNAIPGWEGVAGVYEPGRDVRLSVAVRY
ncbi:TonB-dependent receptor domain-containing protein [Niveispirillum sp. KHB5.9]|uniref:TonB-dependent receptor n=1 Tax=Niveispirillum sp. KHB5.9 TaxID=3400269 RepID=UPI003A8697B9